MLQRLNQLVVEIATLNTKHCGSNLKKLRLIVNVFKN